MGALSTSRSSSDTSSSTRISARRLSSSSLSSVLVFSSSLPFLSSRWLASCLLRSASSAMKRSSSKSEGCSNFPSSASASSFARDDCVGVVVFALLADATVLVLSSGMGGISGSSSSSESSSSHFLICSSLARRRPEADMLRRGGGSLPTTSIHLCQSAAENAWPCRRAWTCGGVCVEVDACFEASGLDCALLV